MEELDLFVKTEDVITLKNYCRLCASYSIENNLVHISEYSILTVSDDKKVNIPEMLKKGLDLDINADQSLPKRMCHKCLDVLIKFFNFKLKCQEAQTTLQNMIKNDEFIMKNDDLFEEITFHEDLDELSEMSEDNKLEEFDNLGEPDDFNEIGKDVSDEKISEYFEEEKFKCLDCHMTFAKKGRLKSHRSTCKLRGSVESKRNGPFTCEICGKVLPTLVGYSTHKTTMHGNPTNSINSTNPESNEVYEVEVDDKIQCLDCLMVFTKIGHLQLHRKTCTLIGSADSKRNGPFKCEKCGKVLDTQVGYSIHKTIHIRNEVGVRRIKKIKKKPTPEPSPTPQPPSATDIPLSCNPQTNYICDMCGKTFRLSSSLRQHILYHSKKKEFECDICGKSFFVKTDLKDHMNIHTAAKKFECPKCHKMFGTYRRMIKHKAIHGERKLQCKMCPKKFFYPYELQAHMNIHTGNKPFACDICPMKFRISHELKVHNKRMHENNEAELQVEKHQQHDGDGGNGNVLNMAGHSGMGIPQSVTHHQNDCGGYVPPMTLDVGPIFHQ